MCQIRGAEILPDKIKTLLSSQQRNYMPGKSDGTLDLIGAEASGTSVHMAGSSVNDSLNALDVGLPCTIGTSVGVGDLNTKGYALATKITLSHFFIAPPIRMFTQQTTPTKGALI